MIVNVQKKIEFINDCECIVDYSLLESAILWYQDKPTSSKKHIYMFGKYAAISIHEKKLHIHRLIMQYLLKNGLSFNKIAIMLNADWSTIKARVQYIHDNPELLEVEE